jgi:NDP-sugar pyrophosphorylase family protein
MVAVVLAAGLGTRLGRRTQHLPKPLVTVHGVSVLSNALCHFAAAGVRATTVVVGYRADDIRNGIGDSVNGMPVQYCVNSCFETTGTARSLLLGLRGLDDDVLVAEGDVFFEEGVLQHFLSEPYPDTTLVERWREAIDGSIVELGWDRLVTRWLHKSRRPSTYAPDSSFKTVNIHRYSAPFVRYWLRHGLESAETSATDPLEFAFARIIERGARIRAVEARGQWVEIDDEIDMQRAEAMFAGASHGSR